MTPEPLAMSDLNAAISFAIQFLGPAAFDLDEDGNPTGYSDAAVEIGRTYFESLEERP